MHIEKIVCANLIGTLLDIPDKTKDGVKSRLDLVELNIRSELAPQEEEKKDLFTPACYTLSRAEKLRNRLEGCMVENYIVEEAIEFCSEFIAGVALDLKVPKNSITPSLRWIAHGPSIDVATYSRYMINGYYYHRKRRDDIRGVQNSGVSITATTMQVSSSKDKNPVISGVKVDELGFTILDLKRVLTSPQRTIEEDFFEDEIGDMLQECGYGTIQRMPNVDTPNEIDDTTSTYIRHDCEGRWVEKVRNITAIFMMEDSSEDEREMLLEFPPKIYSHINEEDWELFVDARLSEELEDYSRIQRKRRLKCVYNHHMSRKGYANLVDELDELVATHKNEDILTDALGSKEHDGLVREEGDSRCKSDKKRSNHSRSSIGSINIDLDVDEDLVNTPSNKGVELSIGSINNIVVVATVVEDNIGCPSVKVLVDVVTGENLTILNPVNRKIETLNQALDNIIE
ncbi:uncharacterized protein E5676_scaffold590G00090 [Cucumis melo var. makuwa]|uniref:Transposase n=1 Tax=Cucumis melo var. makuwa TaxID=1194695 RepID=A0A5A7SVN1_CUCMM|nr:uncharacterized protein E6C27_scaffold845G00320 [Cucumis melo var. makuwa]TYK20416.1 uncharacterized protein E5676_scaffold590G00090 [Cucumis melo var. makuwa]